MRVAAGSSLPAAGALVLCVPVFLLALDGAVGRVPAAVVHGLLLTVVALQGRAHISNNSGPTMLLRLAKLSVAQACALEYLMWSELGCLSSTASAWVSYWTHSQLMSAGPALL